MFETHSARNLHTVAVKVAIGFPPEDLLTRLILEVDENVFFVKCEKASCGGGETCQGLPSNSQTLSRVRSCNTFETRLNSKQSSAIFYWI